MLENWRSTPECFTEQPAIRRSLLRILTPHWYKEYASCVHVCKQNASRGVCVFVQDMKPGYMRVYVPELIQFYYVAT